MKKTNHQRKCKRLVLILLFVLFVFFFVLFSTSFICQYHVKAKSTKNQRNIFQYIETNPLRNETILGLVILFHSKVSYGEYILLQIEKEGTIKEVVISNFGEQDYECEGSCLCVDEKRRTSTSNILSKSGLLVLLSALSISVAFRVSKETFLENCIHHFSDLCSGGDLIVSEVSSCKIVDDPSYYFHENSIYSTPNLGSSDNPNMNDEVEEKEKFVMYDVENEDEEKRLDQQKDNGQWEFICTGYCNPLSSYPNDFFFPNEILGIKSCEGLKMSKKVVVEEFSGVLSFFSDDWFSNDVKSKFVKDHLNEFCREKSYDDRYVFSFCEASVIEVSCRRNARDNVEKLFTLGIEYFIKGLEKTWNDKENRNKFRIEYSDLYHIIGYIMKWPNSGYCVEMYYIDIQSKYRSRGFFERLLKEVEDWGAKQKDFEAIVISDVHNPAFRDFLRRKKMKKLPEHGYRPVTAKGKEFTYYKSKSD